MSTQPRNYEPENNFNPVNFMFDTHKAVKRLQKEGGFTEDAATSIVNIVTENAKYDLSNFATKQELKQEIQLVRQDLELIKKDVEHIKEVMATKEDLAQMQMALKEDLAQLQMTTKEDLAQLQMTTKKDLAEVQMTTKEDLAQVHVKLAQIHASLIRWVIGVGIGIGSAICALIKFLPVIQNIL